MSRSRPHVEFSGREIKGNLRTRTRASLRLIVIPVETGGTERELIVSAILAPNAASLLPGSWARFSAVTAMESRFPAAVGSDPVVDLRYSRHH